MIALARIADRGPFVAAGLAAVLLLMAVLFPILMISGSTSGFLVLLAGMGCMFFLISSAAIVAFVALKHGELSALKVVGGCLVMLIVTSMVLFGTSVFLPLIASIFWLPAILSAMVLARSVKLDYAVLTIVACGVATILGMTLITGDSTEFWRPHIAAALSDAMAALTEGDLGTGALSIEQQEAFIDGMARGMNGAIGSTVVSIALGALFLARSWQAGLFNPGGFQKEFHALSLGRNAALGCVLIVAIAIFLGGQLVGAIAMVVIFAFFVQGLAVTHALVKQRGMHRYWLHGIYLLLLLPHTLLLLAALGLADNSFSLRRSKNV